jgi:hypothetical protein
MAAAIVERAPHRVRRTRTRFYVGLALLIAVITLAGFAPSLYGSVIEGVARPWFIHLHAVVYVGWIALLIAQSVLASNGNIDLHRRVGSFGIAYGCVVLILGVVVTFAAAVVHLKAGEWPMQRAANFLALALGDMVLFGGFFGAAVWYRHRPEIHKRLMLLASVALMFAGAGRLWFLGEPTNIPALLAVWYTPVLIGMAYDLATRRRVHPVYIVGAVIMGAWLVRLPFGASAMWQDIGTRLLNSLSE